MGLRKKSFVRVITMQRLRIMRLQELELKPLNWRGRLLSKHVSAGKLLARWREPTESGHVVQGTYHCSS